MILFVTEVRQLQLKTLDVSCNRIHQLPLDLADMTSLRELILDGNPLDTPPAAVSEQSSFAISKLKVMHTSSQQQSLSKLTYLCEMITKIVVPQYINIITACSKA